MMTLIFNVLSCVFEAMIVFIFIASYSEKEYSSRGKIITAVILLSLMINLSNYILNLGMMNFIVVTLSVFIVACIYNRKIKMNIVLSVISVLILGISEVIVIFLTTIITGVTVKDIESYDDYLILGTIVSKLFAFFIFKFLSSIRKNNKVSTMKTSYWILFIVMLVVSSMTIFLIFKLQYEIDSVILHNLSICCSIGLLYITFFVVYLYENLSKQAELENKQKIFQQQIKAQTKHLEEILVTQNQFRKLRHDIANHLTALQGYFKEKDYNGGLGYLNSMDIITRKSENRIETGNVALDAIINTKRAIAESKNINFDITIQIPEKLWIDPTDICIIFGNALDNAIEACERIKDRKKSIGLSIIYDTESMICKIVNSANVNKSNFLHTNKKDESNHGFGIENIKATISKYKNVFRITHTDSDFTLSFIIFKN